MNSSNSWRFPAASYMVFSLEMFLAGLAPAGRITGALGQTRGRRGRANL